MRFSLVSAVGIALASGLVAGLPTSNEGHSGECSRRNQTAFSLLLIILTLLVDAVDAGLAVRSAGAAGSRPSELEARQCGTYTVRAGDTWLSIASRHNTTVAALQAANPNANPNTLSAGEVLRLPC